MTATAISALSLSLETDRSRRVTRAFLVMRRYLDKVSVKDIGDEFEMSKSQVLRIVRNAGLERRPRGFDMKVWAAVIKDYKRVPKIAIAVIAEKNNVSQAYVSTAARKAGLEPRHETATWSRNRAKRTRVR